MLSKRCRILSIHSIARPEPMCDPNTVTGEMVQLELHYIFAASTSMHWLLEQHIVRNDLSRECLEPMSLGPTQFFEQPPCRPHLSDADMSFSTSVAKPCGWTNPCTSWWFIPVESDFVDFDIYPCPLYSCFFFLLFFFFKILFFLFSHFFFGLPMGVREANHSPNTTISRTSTYLLELLPVRCRSWCFPGNPSGFSSIFSCLLSEA